MEIIVHQAILHVLDTTLDAPVLSGSCMEMTAEKTAYLQYHIEKLLASDDIRPCRPLPDQPPGRPSRPSAGPEPLRVQRHSEHRHPMERGPDHLSPLPVPLVHHLSQHAPHLPHSICRRRPRLCLRALRKAAGLCPPPEVSVCVPYFSQGTSFFLCWGVLCSSRRRAASRSSSQ